MTITGPESLAAPDSQGNRSQGNRSPQASHGAMTLGTSGADGDATTVAPGHAWRDRKGLMGLAVAMGGVVCDTVLVTVDALRGRYDNF